MAVRLPSDLVFDVMKSADPVRHRTALAELQSAGHDSTVAFTEAMKATQKQSGLPMPARATVPGRSLLSASPGAAPQGVDRSSAYQGFERMVLRNLFETLLPDEKSGAFGLGPSAGIWRSMAADNLAEIYIQNGGIGLTRMLSSSRDEDGPRHEAQWPYFSMNQISTVRG
jgi:hypothetical protein